LHKLNGIATTASREAVPEAGLNVYRKAFVLVIMKGAMAGCLCAIGFEGLFRGGSGDTPD
jgi:hypothetical protein